MDGPMSIDFTQCHVPALSQVEEFPAFVHRQSAPASVRGAWHGGGFSIE
jgi:hypothetical protein